MILKTEVKMEFQFDFEMTLGKGDVLVGGFSYDKGRGLVFSKIKESKAIGGNRKGRNLGD